MKRLRMAALVLFGLSTLTLGCEDEIVRGSGSGAAPKKKVVQVDAGAEAGPPKVEFQETDFQETERSRDPFRDFSEMFAVAENEGPGNRQREVVLDQYSIDELKLIGLVTRIVPAKAMVEDPLGHGHVVTRGQFLGRAERVQGGSSGAEYEINWRVDRIRDQDIVLVREDPAHPDVPSATRVMPLRPESVVINAN